MPGERHPQELLHVFGGGLIRDLLPHGRMDMFWGCLSAGTASGSIVHQQLSPTESTTTIFPTFIPPRGASRWRAAPRWRESLAPAKQSGRGSTAQRAIPPPLLDLGHRPVGWGTRRHLRRHAVVRRDVRAAKHLVRRMVMRGGWGRQAACQREGAAAGVWWAHMRIARCSPHGGAAVAAGPRCNHETSV